MKKRFNRWSSSAAGSRQGVVAFTGKVWPAVDQTAKVVFAFIGVIVQDLLLSMLRVDPARRITAKEILDHPWITGGDTSTMVWQINRA